MIPLSRKMPSVRLVFDRKRKATRSTAKDRRAGLVQVEILHEGRRRYISTGVKVYTDQWVQNKEVHVVGSVYARQYNETISQVMQGVLDAVNAQREAGAYDLDALTASPTAVSVGEYGRKVIDLSKAAPNTVKTVGGALRRMDGYKGFNDITAVTRKEVQGYIAWLGDVAGTTVKARLALVRRVFKIAMENGVVSQNPVSPALVPRARPKDRVRLTDEEVAVIAAMQGLPDSVEIARDLFLLQCYTGMAYVDLATLSTGMIIKEGGRTYIVRARQKTGVRYRTMLLKPAEAILEKYGGAVPMQDAFLYNRNLHRVSALSGIGKNITGHVGRHTFATWALSHGTPIEIVSKMLGHTNIETTQIYAKILAKDVDAQFERLDGLF